MKRSEVVEVRTESNNIKYTNKKAAHRIIIHIHT